LIQYDTSMLLLLLYNRQTPCKVLGYHAAVGRRAIFYISGTAFWLFRLWLATFNRDFSLLQPPSLISHYIFIHWCYDCVSWCQWMLIDWLIDRFRRKMKSSLCCDAIVCWKTIVTSLKLGSEQRSTSCKRPRKWSMSLKGPASDILVKICRIIGWNFTAVIEFVSLLLWTSADMSSVKIVQIIAKIIALRAVKL